MHEDVTFWKWINNSTLGIVTETAVYHWSATDGTTAPIKAFDRNATLSGHQIINYRASADEKWLVLIGISGNPGNPAAFKVKGSMQLYNKDRGVSQSIEGHAACFAELRLDGATIDSKLFAFAVRTGAGAKVRIYLPICGHTKWYSLLFSINPVAHCRNRSPGRTTCFR